jgi:hypothetical protein
MNLSNWWYKILNWKKHIIAFGVLLIMIAIIKIFNTIYNSNSIDFQEELINKNYKEFKLNIPPDFNFSGEPVPIEDFEVREKIDKEFVRNSFWKSKSTYHIKRALRWFPLIEPILKSHNIPEDFKYVAMVESGFTNTFSPKGAAGFWQLIEPTAKNYGLEVNEFIDERFNIEKSTIAACRFLNDAYKELGSWTLVAAAYNRGINGISRQIEKQGYNNYYNLYLNTETASYIFKILAIKEIISHPEKYGYKHKFEKGRGLQTKNIQIDSTITDLQKFAQQLQVDYQLLKLLNPWILQNKLPNSDKKLYTIKLPIKGQENSYQLFAAELETVGKFASQKNILNDTVVETFKDSTQKLNGKEKYKY